MVECVALTYIDGMSVFVVQETEVGVLGFLTTPIQVELIGFLRLVSAVVVG
jgi:hypothetical protein